MKPVGRLALASIYVMAVMATPTVAAAQGSANPEQEPGLRIVLIVASVLIGAMVGLIPALLLGRAVGVVPRPRAGMPIPVAAPLPDRGTPAPMSVDREPPQAPARAAPASAQAAAPRERHRALYEAEYSWQELRLEALRQRIRARLENPPNAGGSG